MQVIIKDTRVKTIPVKIPSCLKANGTASIPEPIIVFVRFNMDAVEVEDMRID